MSLIHWWPLNGDTKDYGTENITLTNNGATVNNSGKIGKCYSFTTAQNMNAILDFSKLTTCSVSFWFKIATDEGNWLPFSGQDADKYFMATSGGTGAFYHSGVGALTKTIYCDGIVRNTPLRDGLWHHYCIIGLDLSSWTNFYINDYHHTVGAWNWAGQMNDIRIYDHTLSLKEIKEISKGLVLHYNFEDPYVEGTTNLVTQKIPSGGSYWGGSATTTNSEISTNLVFGNCRSTLYNVTSAMAGCSNSIQSNVAVSSSTLYTYSLYIKTNMPFHANFLYIYEYNSSGTKVTEYGVANTSHKIDCSNGWYRYYGSFTTNSATVKINLATYSYPNSQTGELYRYVGGAQLEQKNHMTAYSYGSRTGSPIYDNSGYGNNGTMSGTPIIVENSMLGNYSVTFPNASSYIVTPSISMSGFTNSYTFSWWAKKENLENSMAWGFKDGNRLNIYPVNGILCWNTGDGATNPFKDGSTSVSFTPYNNSWHMFTVTGDGTSSNLYIDGIYKGKATTYKAITGTQIYISGWDTSGSYKWTNGNIADFKIYATALSAEDIKAEYQRKASIDKQGNLYTGLFEQNTTNIALPTKTGIVKANHYVEGGNKTSLQENYVELEYIDNVNPAAGATSEHNRCIMNSIQYDRIEARLKVTGSGTSGGIMISGATGN